MSTVAEYQQALRELSEAGDLWSTLIARLQLTIDHFAKDDPLSFDLKPDHKVWVDKGRTATVSPVPMRHDEWPSADDVSALAKRVAAARKAIKSIWFELPQADRIGLKVPPA